MKNLSEATPIPAWKKVVIGTLAMSTVGLSADRSALAQDEPVESTTPFIDWSSVPNKYPGLVRTIGNNRIITNTLCGWESNNPEKRAFGHVVWDRARLAPGERAILEIWSNDPIELTALEIIGEPQRSESHIYQKATEVPLGWYSLYLIFNPETPQQVIVFALDRDFICHQESEGDENGYIPSTSAARTEENDTTPSSITVDWLRSDAKLRF